MNWFIRTIFFFTCILSTTLLLAQGRGGVGGGGNPFGNSSQYGNSGGTLASRDSSSFERVPDTVRITYVLAENPGQEYIFSDTLLNQQFQQYDPARKRLLPYANLGNPGSAARPIVFEMQNRRGFDVGFHQYDIYNNTPEDIAFYTLKPAYTKAEYSQGNDQNDSRIDAVFGRKFAGGLSMSILYNRLIHSLENSALTLNQNIFYPYQSARHTNIGLGLRFQSKNKRYDAFLRYNYNQNRAIDHGGIIASAVTDSLLMNGDTLEGASLPVYQPAETSVTNYTQQVISYTHYYDLGRVDSLGNVKRSYQLSHEFQLTSSRYKFSETSPDTAFYSAFLITDNRGLRQYTELNAIENHFTISTSRSKENNKAVKKQSDLLKVGLLQRQNKVQLEPIDTTIQNLFLTGQFNFAPNDRLNIQTYAHLGLWNQAGDYQIKGDFFLDLKQLGQLKLYANQQLFEPSLIQTRNYITETLLWDNDFRKTLETQIGGTWSRPAWKFSVTANYFLLNNYIYFDATFQPQQFTSAFSIGQLIIQKDIQFGRFHLDNIVTLQQNSTSALLRLPTLMTQNSLYFEGYIFKKKMFTRIGLDLLLQSDYFADSYQPAIGQFYVQNTREVELYPAVDAFFNLKVDRFRAFFKMENLTSLLTTDIYYQTPNFPQKEMYFRFGIVWMFLDANTK